MKLFIVFLIAFNFLNALTDVQISNLELSKHQVLGFEARNNKLYIMSYGGGDTPAILDVYDMDKHTIEKDILKNSGESIAFGNSPLFKDSQNNLWVGGVNQLLKIDINDNVSNIYKNVKLPDSTYFEIEAITEDINGNIYFLKENNKIMTSKKEGGTTYKWVESYIEIVKFDEKKTEILYTTVDSISNVSSVSSSMYFFEGKLYCPILIPKDRTPKLYIFDLKTKEFASPFTLPTVNDIPELEWEEVKQVDIKNIFEFNNQLYLFAKIDASVSWFYCFVKYNDVIKKFEYFSLPRKNEKSDIAGITSFTVFDGKIICAGDSFYNPNEERTFYEFKNDEYTQIYPSKNFIPKLIANPVVYPEIKSRNLKFESGEFGFTSSMKLYKGDLYGGTNKGLIYIENFLQPTSVQPQELNISTFPDLTSVKNELIINSEFIISSYSIYDVNSKTLQTKANLNSNDIYLNLEDLTVGIYFIELETQKGNKLLKFIKN